MKRAIEIQSHENNKQSDCEFHPPTGGPLRTKNENEMKTKNNVQKAILRSVAVVVSFVLISFTVSAQDFWKRLIENSSFKDIAMVMVETNSETKLSTAPAESLEARYFENEIEPGLELEDWMTDYSNFDVNTFQYDEAFDAVLTIEEWMLNENLFQPEREVEGSLELESWMTSEKVWNI